jgi:hypothetical protein
MTRKKRPCLKRRTFRSESTRLSRASQSQRVPTVTIRSLPVSVPDQTPFFRSQMPAQTGTPESPVPVPAIEDMDKETFCKHFTLRHPENLANTNELPAKIQDNVEVIYRRYHDQLHRVTPFLKHEHREAKK